MRAPRWERRSLLVPGGAVGQMVKELNRNPDEVRLLIRRKDMLPVYAVGDMEALLGIRLEDLQGDVATLLPQLADPAAGRALWKSYAAWDGAQELTDELHMKNGEWKPDGRMLGTLCSMGIPMGLQYSITAIGSMVMQSANNGLGSIYVSGFTAGMRIKQFAMCPFDALANGVSVFCSQNLGAGKIKRIRKGLWQGVGVGFIYGLLIGLVLIFAGRSLSMLFISADQTAVLDASAKYLRCLGFFYWSLGPLSVFRMSAQGMGFSGRAIFSGVTEMIARTFVSFAFVGTYGFTAICFADQTAWVSATLYITPVCLMCLRQVTREHERQQAKIAD